MTGTPSLCAPPRLYNQITIKIADLMESSDLDVARLLALVNVAMADAGMAVWESKYYYDLWRPITGIRESIAAPAPRAQVTATPEQPVTRLFCRWARRPAICGAELHTAFSGLSVRARRIRRGAFPNVASLLQDRLHSLLLHFRRIQWSDERQRPGNTAHCCHAPSRRSRRRKKKTARAESISAFIGPSINRKALPKAGVSPIMVFETPLSTVAAQER